MKTIKEITNEELVNSLENHCKFYMVELDIYSPIDYKMIELKENIKKIKLELLNRLEK